MQTQNTIIARTWHGVVSKQDPDDYYKYLLKAVVKYTFPGQWY